MSKQLTEEFQAKIKEWAAANAATEATTFDETRYVGIIDGAWWMAEQLEEAQERIKSLEIALQVVAQWGLPETGRFWDDDKTQPMSFGACYGSNGERDYMRSIASEALSPNNKQKEDE